MLKMNDDEIRWLQELGDSPKGELPISGNKSHKGWERLVVAGYVTQTSVWPDIIIYSITLTGRNALKLLTY